MKTDGVDVWEARVMVNPQWHLALDVSTVTGNTEPNPPHPLHEEWIVLHYSSVTRSSSFKRDHAANMEYTLDVEHLMKYWLQT